MTFPKIELHVHLEGTVRAPALLEMARRNDLAPPADSAAGLAALYEFTDYALEAASHGAVYVEGIFSPAEAVARGAGRDEVFAGYCDGAAEASELHGVRVRLTPDVTRGMPLGVALGVFPAECYAAGVRGALCDDDTRTWLARVGAECDWPSVSGGVRTERP